MRKPTRRSFLLAAAAAAAASARPTRVTARRVGEWSFETSHGYSDPFWDLTLDVVFREPGGRERRAPAFWSGGRGWRVRYAPPEPGSYSYRTICSNAQDADLHGVEGAFTASELDEDHPLYSRGGLRVSSNRRFLEHEDGTPFPWLGDTWWMGLCKRLRWPDEFQELAADRLRKGFNLIQIVAGLYPDQPSFDPRGANEAGHPWENGYTRIHPSYFDEADVRIRYLVEVGLMPCIVGCWGYYLPLLGRKKMERHWRYVVARWGAYPVVWCLAGEGSMPWYLGDRTPEERAALETGWTEMARYLRRTNPFERPITIHPSSSGRDVVRDASVLDFDMLQTGHGDYRSIPRTIQLVAEGYARQPRMPVVEGEVCYEGIMESCRQDIQRFMFWTTMLNGCCGFTYGANGIWQLNRPGEPYGPSPHGRTWGDTPWREAMQAPGGRQVGIGSKILRELPWHRMEPHPEWVEPHWSEQDYRKPSAAGVPGEFRVVYLTAEWNPPKLKALEPGLRYQAVLHDPSTGRAHPITAIEGDAVGESQLPTPPSQRDWVLTLTRV